MEAFGFCHTFLLACKANIYLQSSEGMEGLIANNLTLEIITIFLEIASVYFSSFVILQYVVTIDFYNLCGLWY